MDTFGWNTLLFALKWVFIGLIYFVLVFIVLAVRREMALRVKSSPEESDFSPGRLRVVSAGSDTKLRAGATLELKPVTTLGSGAECDLVLRDRFVSKEHTRLRWDGVGWWAEDLGSRNGTFINNEPCPPNTPVKIEPGSNLVVGGITFQLIE